MFNTFVTAACFLFFYQTTMAQEHKYLRSRRLVLAFRGQAKIHLFHLIISCNLDAAACRIHSAVFPALSFRVKEKVKQKEIEEALLAGCVKEGQGQILLTAILRSTSHRKNYDWIFFH